MSEPVTLEKVADLFAPFESWKDWHKVWLEEMARPEPRLTFLLGHLHFIFSVQGGYWPAVIFLLELADGYRHGQNLETDGYRIYNFNRRHNYHDHEKRNGKVEIAEKAWRLLCDNFFLNTPRPGSDGPYPSWATLAMEKDVFLKLVWFFDPARRKSNLPIARHPNRHDQIALEFLREFVRIAWFFSTFSRGEPSDEDKAVQELVYRSRPKLVEILAAVQDLDFLFTSGVLKNRRIYPEFYIDEASLAKLEELAKNGGEKSIEEMIWAGSYAARTLIAVCAAMAEDERQERIAEAKHKADEAARELEETKQQIGTRASDPCPDCGATKLTWKGGVLSCSVCGYNEKR